MPNTTEKTFLTFIKYAPMIFIIIIFIIFNIFITKNIENKYNDDIKNINEIYLQINKQNIKDKNSLATLTSSFETKTKKLNEKKQWLILGISTLITMLFILLSLFISKVVEKKIRKYKKLIEEKEKETISEVLNISETYKDLFESNKSKILLIDPKGGEIINANKSAIKFYGYSRPKLLSMNINQINTLSKDEIITEMHKAIKEKRDYFNFIHKLSNGEKREVQVSSSPSKYHHMTVLFSVVHDVTHLHKIESKLIKREEQLKIFFNLTINLHVITTTDGSITQINKAAKTMLGYEEEELLNTSFFDLVHPEDIDSTIEEMKKLSRGENIYFFENRYMHKDGSFIYLAWSATTDSTNKIIYASAQNNTTVKLIELEKNEKNKLLAQQSKMASMGEMIGNIAHQWRQPLSIISTISSGINMQIDFKQLKEETLISSMKDIQSSVNHLSNTIDDFRNFFNPDKEKSSFMINIIIEKTLKLISAKLKSEEIEIILDICPIEIKSFENELIQVLMNIITNSSDVLKDRTNPKFIFIKTLFLNGNLVLVLKDNAGGIDSDKIDRIFEPYFTTKHKSQGTGIGLYMSEEIIVKHMNGSITVKNSKFNHNNIEYTGAEFRITLPLETNKLVKV